METDEQNIQILPTGPETLVEIKTRPRMGLIFLKAILISPFRSHTLAKDAIVNRTRIVLNDFLADPKQVEAYRTVCGFSDDRPDIFPISYLQTLFIGLLGKFITSCFFPINPLGLIQIFQSFEQKRPVALDESLDLVCTLLGFNKTEKGVETHFTLDVVSGGDTVWHGVSIFFTRTRGKKKRSSKKPDELFLEQKESILVPSGIGRRYAAVSGDYNPHHLYTLLAKGFGFKSAIAHGMWSLARVVASLERMFDLHGSATVEASFKLPIFMPAATALGYDEAADQENGRNLVNFELRDKQKGLPHLKGRLLYTKSR